MPSHRYILVAGSHELEDLHTNGPIAKEIGSKIVSFENWKLLNGGAKGTKENSAVDYLACQSAREKLLQRRKNISDRIVTLYPYGVISDPNLHDIGEIIRAGKTRASRRYRLVAKADAVITIAGDSGTKQIIDLAMALEKPVLPIPCTGGSSKEVWNESKYVPDLLMALGLAKDSDKYNRLMDCQQQDPVNISELVIEIIKEKIRQSCFVAIEYSEAFIDIYDKIIRPTIEKAGYNAVLASDHKSGILLQNMLEEISKSSVFLADITGLNHNVLYELGIAHALGKKSIIISQDSRDKLPFDIRHHAVICYTQNKQDIQRYTK
jgi:hypothetical protein